MRGSCSRVTGCAPELIKAILSLKKYDAKFSTAASISAKIAPLVPLTAPPIKTRTIVIPERRKRVFKLFPIRCRCYTPRFGRVIRGGLISQRSNIKARITATSSLDDAYDLQTQVGDKGRVPAR